MIRRLKVTVNNFVKNELPAHLRDYANQLTFFRGLMAPLKAISEEWDSFRDKSVTRARVTGETASLEWHLNELFDVTLRRVYIQTAGVSGVGAGIEATEPTLFFVAGIESSEATMFKLIGLKGEDTGFLDNAFLVFVPSVLTGSADAISAVVRQYKFAGKKFSIKPF